MFFGCYSSPHWQSDRCCTPTGATATQLVPFSRRQRHRVTHRSVLLAARTPCNPSQPIHCVGRHWPVAYFSFPALGSARWRPSPSARRLGLKPDLIQSVSSISLKCSAECHHALHLFSCTMWKRGEGGGSGFRPLTFTSCSAAMSNSMSHPCNQWPHCLVS